MASTNDRDSVTFASPISNLRLVRANRLEEESRFGGSRQLVSPGLRYEFEDGFLVVDAAMHKRDAKFFKKYADADDTLEDTRPADEWLRDHNLFGVEKGFVEVARIVAPSAPVLLEVTNALLDENVERLVEIYEAEEQGDQRPDVMEAVTGSLRKLEAAEPAKAG